VWSALSMSGLSLESPTRALESAVQVLKTWRRAPSFKLDAADITRCMVRDALRVEERSQHEVAQRLVRDTVLKDPVCSKFPPPRGVDSRFCKEILKVLESGYTDDVDDELYSLCVEGIRCPEDHDVFEGHCALDIGQGSVVLRVSSNLGFPLETGGRLWPGGCALFGLCAGGFLDDLLQGHVLELGAGTGVVGLGLACRGAPVTRVTMTDDREAVVDNLRHNTKATAMSCPMVPCESSILAWGEPLPSFGEVDVIVGSELTYDETGHLPLARTLRELLKPIGTARVAVLAAVVRGGECFESFVSTLCSQELCWRQVPLGTDAQAVASSWTCFSSIDPYAMDVRLLHVTASGSRGSVGERFI